MLFVAASASEWTAGIGTRIHSLALAATKNFPFRSWAGSALLPFFPAFLSLCLRLRHAGFICSWVSSHASPPPLSPRRAACRVWHFAFLRSHRSLPSRRRDRDRH